MLSQAISAAEARLTPVTEKQLMVGIAQVLKHAKTYSIPNVDAKDVAESYRVGLAGIPALLFETALMDALKYSADTFRVPTPGSIWDRIRDKHAKWTVELRRLETAEWKMRQIGEWKEDDGGPRVIDEETKRLMDETMRILKGAATRMKI